MMRNCGDVWNALVERYGGDDVTLIARESGISRSTLLYWQDHMDSPLYKRGRDHAIRIFGREWFGLPPIAKNTATDSENIAAAFVRADDAADLTAANRESQAEFNNAVLAKLDEISRLLKGLSYDKFMTKDPQK